MSSTEGFFGYGIYDSDKTYSKYNSILWFTRRTPTG
jgi:hypothetical protein